MRLSAGARPVSTMQAAALTATRPLRLAVHAPAPRARLGCVRVSAANNNQWGKKAEDFGKEAQRRSQEFVRDNQLDEKAKRLGRQVSSKFQEASADVQRKAQSQYRKLDEKYDISKNVEKASKQARYQAQDLDERYAIRRRINDLISDVKRKWPAWKRKAIDFYETPIGKATSFALLLYSISTGLLFQLLGTLLNLWWFLAFFVYPIASIVFGFGAQKRAEETARAQAEAQRRSNPFAGFGGFGQQQNSNNNGAGAGYGDGPVVDAEWTTVDDPKKR